jgi:glucokinase
MSLKVRRETVLSGDIGGTNSRFMLHEIKITDPSLFKSQFKSIDDLPSTLILNKKYENKDFPSFMDVLKQFLKDAGVDDVNHPPLTACFAVAGPVQDNVVRFTNRDLWSVDGDVVASELNIAVVKLVNDFLAVGYGLLTLNEGTECVTLQAATKQTNAPIACIGAGTGLGECFLVPDSSGSYQCYPSEGGHAEFAPRNEVSIT